MLENIRISKDFLPKYYSISQKIIDRIRAGELPPGAKIPSENEIIKIYNVSNTTARKVLLEIEKGGWISRIKGRGSFVNTSNIVNRSATKVLSFTKNMRQAGLVPSTRLLDIKTIRKGMSITISGRNYNIREPVCKITRLRIADEIPMMIENRYISLKFCLGIENENLEDSLYEIYMNKYNLQITQIDQSLESIIIPEELNKHFQTDKIVPGFKVQGVTFCGKELILEIEESIYRGDRYKFTIQAVP